MKLAFKLIDKLIANPSKMNLIALDKLFKIGIPFNAPHGFKIVEMNQDKVRITLPNRKLNHNHLSGIHACAIATVGEFCAGLSLLSSFGISQYRLIMSEMHVTYTYQGKMDLEGVCLVQQIDQASIHTALRETGQYLQKLITKISDKNGNEVATVTTTWQLKPWDKVKTKI